MALLPPKKGMVLLLLCTLLCVAHLHIAQARVHGHHPTKLRLLNSSPVNGPVAKPNYYGYDGYPNRRPTCSCADPVSVPLELDHRSPIPVGNRPEYVYPAGAYDEDEYGDNVCHDLPLSQPDGDCGAQVGVCPSGFCCSQFGQCTKSKQGCDGTCQCRYSGAGSGCKGSFPFPLPRSLPVADEGGLCGAYVATCPTGQCCSQFGFCLDDSSIYCNMPSCILAASALSATCGGQWASSSSSSKSKTATTTTTPQSTDGAKAGGAATNTQGADYGRHGSYAPDGVSLIDETFNAETVRRFEWVATWKNETLDGFTKPVIVINGSPFPTVDVEVNDRVVVSIRNMLTESLSIHWHGMLQRRTNMMDGVVPVTQRPVQPGETFVYNFIADTAGTFWWHSHYGTQYVDGLWGALIVRDPSARPTYETDAVVTITDYYHELATPLTDYYLSPESGGDEPTPYDALMNGWGQGSCGGDGQPACTYARIKGAAGGCDNPQTKLRFINAGAFAVFNVSIDNHRMIVVAEDGVVVDPVPVGSMQINNGQRYDVLVCQPDGGNLDLQPVWIRAVMIDDNFPQPSNYNTTLGVLYYQDSDANALPTTTETYEPPALTPTNAGEGYVSPYELHAVGGIRPPGPPTMELEYLIYFYNEPFNDPNATQYAHFSKISLQMDPETPSLLERLSNNPSNLGPPRNVPVPPGGRGWHVVDIPLGSIVDIVINNNDTGEHPIHLHGHWFWVMDAGLPYAGSYDRITQGPRAAEFGRLARDTVTVNTKSYVVLRYLAVNPGVWILHCHIDWHLAAGLGLLFKEGFPPESDGYGGYGGGGGGSGYDAIDDDRDSSSSYSPRGPPSKDEYEEKEYQYQEEKEQPRQGTYAPPPYYAGRGYPHPRDGSEQYNRPYNRHDDAREGYNSPYYAPPKNNAPDYSRYGQEEERYDNYNEDYYYNNRQQQVYDRYDQQQPSSKYGGGAKTDPARDAYRRKHQERPPVYLARYEEGPRNPHYDSSRRRSARRAAAAAAGPMQEWPRLE